MLLSYTLVGRSEIKFETVTVNQTAVYIKNYFMINWEKVTHNRRRILDHLLWFQDHQSVKNVFSCLYFLLSNNFNKYFQTINQEVYS